MKGGGPFKFFKLKGFRIFATLFRFVLRLYSARRKYQRYQQLRLCCLVLNCFLHYASDSVIAPPQNPKNYSDKWRMSQGCESLKGTMVATAIYISRLFLIAY